jgi:hypothetical protein
MKYEYIVNIPDGELVIESDIERTKDEIADWLRTKDWQQRPFTKDEIKANPLPSGVLVQVQDGETVQPYFTARGGFAVPAAQYAMGIEAIRRAGFEGEEAAPLIEKFDAAFREGLELGRDESFRRRARTGFGVTGIGSIMTNIRVPQSKPGAPYTDREFRAIEQAIAEDTNRPLWRRQRAQRAVAKLDAKFAKTAESIIPELEVMGRINSLPDAPTFWGKAGDFGAELLGSMPSPENLVTIAPGRLIGKTLLGTIAKRFGVGAAENVLAEGLITPSVTAATYARGQDMGMQEHAMRFGFAALGGGILKNAFDGIGDAINLVRKTSGQAPLSPDGALFEGDIPLNAQDVTERAAKAYGMTPEQLLLTLEQADAIRNADLAPDAPPPRSSRLLLEDQVQAAIDSATAAARKAREADIATAFDDADRAVIADEQLRQSPAGLERLQDELRVVEGLTTDRPVPIADQFAGEMVDIRQMARERIPEAERVPSATPEQQMAAAQRATTEQRLADMQAALAEAEAANLAEAQTRQSPLGLAQLREELGILESISPGPTSIPEQQMARAALPLREQRMENMQAALAESDAQAAADLQTRQSLGGLQSLNDWLAMQERVIADVPTPRIDEIAGQAVDIRAMAARPATLTSLDTQRTLSTLEGEIPEPKTRLQSLADAATQVADPNSPDATRIFSELGDEIEPRARLGDKIQIGQVYAAMRAGMITEADFNRFLDENIRKPLGLVGDVSSTAAKVTKAADTLNPLDIKQAGEAMVRDVSAPTTRPVEAKRSRPLGTVYFENNGITGPTGVRLQAYEWANKKIEEVDERGEERIRRISDWEEAATNEATGRDVVHQFQIQKPDGTFATVSLETALREMGYLPQSEGGKTVKSLASTLKTRATNMLQLQAVEPLANEWVAWNEAFKRAQDQVAKLEPPPMEYRKDGKRSIFFRGDAEASVSFSRIADERVLLERSQLSGVSESLKDEIQRLRRDVLGETSRKWSRMEAAKIAGPEPQGGRRAEYKARDLRESIANLDTKIAKAVEQAQAVTPQTAPVAPTTDTAPTGRFVVVRPEVKGKGYREIKTTDDIVAYAKDNPNDYGVRYYDTQTDKWVVPGVRGPKAGKGRPSEIDEIQQWVIDNGGLLTADQMRAKFRAADDTFTQADQDQHEIAVKAAEALGLRAQQAAPVVADAVPDAAPVVKADDVPDATPETAPTIPPTILEMRELGTGEHLIASGKPGGMRAIVEYDIVPAEQLDALIVTEVGADQNRSRSLSRASDEQIFKIRSQPDEMRLLESPTALEGAPVITDSAVVAGNGRALGIVQGLADKTDVWTPYREALPRIAKRLGIDASKLDVENPVLVRRIKEYVSSDGSSQDVFVIESNPKSVGLQESVAEQALNDFNALEAAKAQLDFRDDGALTSESAWALNTVLDKVQRPITRKLDGTVDPVEASKRAQAALMAGMARKAGVGFEDVVELLEGTDGRRVVSAIMSRAGLLASNDADLSLGRDLMQAFREWQRGKTAVRGGQYENIRSWFKNRSEELIREETSPEAEMLLGVILEFGNKPTQLKEILDGYIQLANAEQSARNAGNTDFFSGPRKPTSALDLIAKTEYGPEVETGDLFAAGGGTARKTLGQRAVDWADGIIAEQGKKLSANPFLDPSVVTAYAIKGIDLLNRAAHNFGKWSKLMLNRYGPAIKDGLKKIWAKIKEIGGSLKKKGGLWARTKVDKLKETLLEGLTDTRRSYLRKARDMDFGQQLERRARLFEQEAKGTVRLMRDIELPVIRKEMADLAQGQGMTVGTFRTNAFTYGRALQALAVNRVHGDGAAGMDDATARATIQSFTKEQKQAFNVTLDRVRDIHVRALELRQASGLIDRETFERLRATYPDYVSLQRIMPEDDEGAFESSVFVGQRIVGSGVHSTKGWSELPYADLLELALEDFETTVRRAKANDFNRAMLGHMMANEEKYKTTFGDVFKVVRPYPEKFKGTKRLGVDATGKPVEAEVEGVRYPKAPDNAIPMRIDGKPVWLMVNNKELRDAMLNSPLPNPLKYMVMANGMLSALHTSWNISSGFQVRNFIRDTQETWFNLQRLIDNAPPGIARLMAENIASLKTGLQYHLGTMGQSFGGRQVRALLGESNVQSLLNKPDTMLYRQFIRDGGSSGGVGMAALRELEKSLSQLNMLDKVKNYPVTQELAHMVSRYTELFEEANRFSAYKLAINSGKTREEAALIARNTSFDPAQRGKWGNILGAFHLFVNPTAQGSANNMRTAMRYPKALTKAVMGLSLITGLAWLWNNTVDPQWNDGVGQFARDFNIPIITGREEYVDDDGNPQSKYKWTMIPVAHPLLPTLKAVNLAMREFSGNYEPLTAAEGMREIGNSIMDGYMFVPMSEKVLSNGNVSEVISGMFTPAFVAPIQDVRRNRNWLEQLIKPEGMSVDDVYEYAKYRDYMLESPTGRQLVSLSEWLHNNVGVDISPEVMRFYLESYGSGIYKTTSSGFDTMARLLTGEQISRRDLPVLKAFLRETDTVVFDRNKKAKVNIEQDVREYATEKYQWQQGMKRDAEAIKIAAKNDIGEADRLFANLVSSGRINGLDGQVDKSKFDYMVTQLKQPESVLPGGYRNLKKFRVEDGSRARMIHKVLSVLASGAERETFIQQLQSEPDMLTRKVAAQLQALIDAEPLPE